MSNEIFTFFSGLNIKINTSEQRKMELLVSQFEIRDANPLTLNSNLIGVYPIAFTTQDRSAFFDIFKIDESSITKYMKKVLLETKQGKVNISDRRVASDEFNLLCVWLMHLGLTTINNKNDRHRFCMSVAKYLHYRYFTSCINNSFRYGADEEVMQAVVEDLSKKFAITNSLTWKQDIENSCELLLSNKSKHESTLQYPINDESYLYVITDTQTLLRSKLVNIAQLYYDYHKQDKRIKSKTSVGTDGEGEKYIIEKISTFDTIQSQVLSDLPSVGNFINSSIVNSVASQFNNMSVDMFRKLLMFIVNRASIQTTSSDYDNIVVLKNKSKQYVGMRILVKTIILTSFRLILENNISIKNKIAIWKHLKNVYSSSRIINNDIADIKNSIMIIIDDSGISNRDSTKSTMRLSVIMYIVYLCIIKLK